MVYEPKWVQLDCDVQFFNTIFCTISSDYQYGMIHIERISPQTDFGTNYGTIWYGPNSTYHLKIHCILQRQSGKR